MKRPELSLDEKVALTYWVLVIFNEDD